MALVDPTTGGPRLKIRDCIGRTIIVICQAYDKDAVDQNGSSRPTVIADIIVCDGGRLEFGSNIDNGTPNTHYITAPCLFSGAYISSTSVVHKVKLQVGNGVVGFIERGDRNPKAFVFRPVADASKRAVAERLYDQYENGVLAPVEPIEIGAPAESGSSEFRRPDTVPEAIWNTLTDAQKRVISL